MLRTGGVTADSIVEGDRVTAVVSPSRRFPNQTAYGHEIVKSDGTVVPLAARGLRRPQIRESARSIFGTWVPPAESFAVQTGFPIRHAATLVRSRTSDPRAKSPFPSLSGLGVRPLLCVRLPPYVRFRCFGLRSSLSDARFAGVKRGGWLRPTADSTKSP